MNKLGWLKKNVLRNQNMKKGIKDILLDNFGILIESWVGYKYGTIIVLFVFLFIIF
jgi:hypothetical protein